MENDVYETRKRLIEELSVLGEKMVRGSFVHSQRTRQDGAIRDVYRLMIPAGASKSRGVYIAKSIADEVVVGTEAFKRATDILRELAAINIDILLQRSLVEKEETMKLRHAASVERKQRIKRERAEASERRRARREELRQQVLREREELRQKARRDRAELKRQAELDAAKALSTAKAAQHEAQKRVDPKNAVLKGLPPPPPKKPQHLTAKDLMQPSNPDDAVPLLASSSIPLLVNLPK